MCEESRGINGEREIGDVGSYIDKFLPKAKKVSTPKDSTRERERLNRKSEIKRGRGKSVDGNECSRVG